MKAFVQFDRKRLRQLAALVGIVLVAAFSVLQTVHTHSGLTENAHCAICAVAHVPVGAAAPVVLPALVFTRFRPVLLEPVLRSSATLSLHFCRPPPPTA